MTTEAPAATILVVDHSPSLATKDQDDCNETVSTDTDADSVSPSFSDSHSVLTMDDPDAKPITTPVITTTPTYVERSNVTVQDHKGCTGVYSGRLLMLEDDQLIPDGPGTMEYSDHPTVATYTGHWKEGAWSGQGQASLTNGDSFSGEHVHGQRHGSGTYTWADGRSYAGTFWHDQRHGQGSYQWPCGANYCGAYEQGVRTGYGKYLDPTDGISYQGEWKGGVYHGYGVLTTTVNLDESNSTDLPKRVYRGQFDNGQAHGQGVETLPDGTIRHDGLWNQGVPVHPDGSPIEAPASPTVSPPPPEFTVVQNETVQDANGLAGTFRGILHVASHKPHGNGVLTYQSLPPKQKDDQLDFYEGCFDMGAYHGRGRLHWKNGDSYDGEYVNGKRQGPGVYKWSDGRHYKGEFFNDQRDGFGKFVYGRHQNADWYQGEFSQGRRQGKGRFVFSDGSNYEGEWKAGVYHGQGTLVDVSGKEKGGTSTYTGEFQRGVAHGQGKEVAQDGTVRYEGIWIDGDPEEEARRKAAQAKERMAHETTMRQPRRDQESTTAKGSLPEPECEAVVDLQVKDAEGNKGQYTGLVLCSSRKPHGVGRMVYLDGRRIHEGFWKNGMKDGHGRCLFVEQGDFHEGEYSNNVRHGPGKYKWRDGRVFIGHYDNDLRNGKGVFTYPNGEQYEGMFTNGEKHGHGRFEFRGGFYVGAWEQGRYHGKGRLSIRGEELEGVFRDGEFVGKATCDVHGEAPADEESKEEAELVAQRMESVDLDDSATKEDEEEVDENDQEGVVEETAEEAESEKVDASD